MTRSIRYLLLTGLAAALVCGPGALIAQTTITALPAGSALTGTEPIPMDQTGSCSATGGTCKTTPAAINTYVEANSTGLGGDCTMNSSFQITCTKTSGVTFAPVATSGSASDLAAGTLGAARMPALTGDCTTSAGAVATTCTKTSGTAFGTFATQNYATPPAIGGTTPAAGAFSTLSASSTISGTGFSTYLASPPAIGGTTAAAVTCTICTANNVELAASQSAVGNGFYNGAAGNQVNVSIGGSNIGDFTSTGLNSMAVGASTASTGAFTALTTTGGVGMTGAVVSINASSNFNTNINTGTSNGTVTIGNANNNAAIYGTVTINANNSTHTTAINTGTTSGTVTIGGASNTADIAAATVEMPAISANTGAQTGYLCWSASTITYDGTNTCLVSAARFKKDITPLGTGLDEVMQLKPVSFYYREPFPGDLNMGNEQIGFIAEDVAAVEPRLVTYDKDGQLHGVRYEQMTSLLAKGEQELQTEVLALKAQNAALEARLSRLENARQ